MDTSGAATFKPVWSAGSAIGQIPLLPSAAGVYCPWISRDEWEVVYSWLFSSHAELMKKGVGRVSAWKARGRVPMAVELTADLIECILMEKEGFSSFQSLNLLYAMAISRFINGVNELVKMRKNTLHKHIAFNVVQFNVPSWLVELRHCGTHEKLPSLSAMKTGAEFSLSWLRTNYWEPQSLTIGEHYEHSLVNEVASSVDVRASNGKDSAVYKLTRGLCRTKFELLDLLTTSSISEIAEYLKKGQLLQFQDNIQYHVEVPDISDLTGFPEISISAKDLAIWGRHLVKAGSKDNYFKQRLISAIISVVNNSECDVNLRDYLGGWLGKLLTQHVNTHKVEASSKSDDSHEEVLPGGQLDWSVLLNAAKEFPGYYSMAVINIILEHLNSFLSKSIIENVRYLTTLITRSSRISSSSYIGGTRSGHYEREFEELRTRLIQEGVTSKQLVVDKGGVTCQRWLPVEDMTEWVTTPLGLHPNQEVSSNMFDINSSTQQVDSDDHDGNNIENEQQTNTRTYNRTQIVSQVTLF